MVSKVLKITNPTGFHLRPAGKLCDRANRYEKCRIRIIHGRINADAKSFLQVLGAGVKHGDEITITCEGEDEERVLEEMVSFINNDLGR